MISETRRKVWAIVLSLAIFCAGIAAGVAIDRMIWCKGAAAGNWWKQRQPEALVELFQRELDLSDQQNKAVTAILMKRWADMSQVFKQVDPQTDAIRARSYEEIRAILSDAQKPKFEKMVQEHEERRRDMRKRFDSQR